MDYGKRVASSFVDRGGSEERVNNGLPNSLGQVRGIEEIVLHEEEAANRRITQIAILTDDGKLLFSDMVPEAADESAFAAQVFHKLHLLGVEPARIRVGIWSHFKKELRSEWLDAAILWDYNEP